jgi:hypothetical protein
MNQIYKIFDKNLRGRSAKIALAFIVEPTILNVDSDFKWPLNALLKFAV